MLARNHPAVWLFIRYDGLPGLFFAVTVLCAGWFYLRGNRTDAVGYLSVLAAFWLTLQFIGPYPSLWNRVVRAVGTKRFQRWAVDVLDNPSPGDEHGFV